jgi:hypothetical protein
MGRKKAADFPAVAPPDADALPEVEQTENHALKDTNLKACPKCDGKCTGAYKDVHGNYRCHCSEPRCGFWDSVVSMTPEDARYKWQACGGPNKI